MRQFILICWFIVGSTFWVGCTETDTPSTIDAADVAMLPSPSQSDQGILPLDITVSEVLPDNSIHVWTIVLETEMAVTLQFDSVGWMAFLTIPEQPEILVTSTRTTRQMILDAGEYQIQIRDRYGGGPYTLTLHTPIEPTPTFTPPVPTPTAIPTDVNEVSLGSGDVQITLRWRTLADLDLHVIEPSGEEINFMNRLSATDGQLDVDANHPCNTRTTTPVENIFWPEGASPTGDYEVRVHYHPLCGDEGPTAYEVTVIIGDGIPQRFSGTLNGPDDDERITSFTTTGSE